MTISGSKAPSATLQFSPENLVAGSTVVSDPACSIGATDSERRRIIRSSWNLQGFCDSAVRDSPVETGKGEKSQDQIRKVLKEGMQNNYLLSWWQLLCAIMDSNLIIIIKQLYGTLLLQSV